MTADQSGLLFHFAALRKSTQGIPERQPKISPTSQHEDTLAAPVKAEPEHVAAKLDELRCPITTLPDAHGVSRRVCISTRVAENRSITITGAEGMGKNTVVVSAAQELAQTFGGAVLFVDFSEVNDPDYVPSVLVTMFGITAPTPDLLPGLSISSMTSADGARRLANS